MQKILTTKQQSCGIAAQKLDIKINKLICFPNVTLKLREVFIRLINTCKLASREAVDCFHLRKQKSKINQQGNFPNEGKFSHSGNFHYAKYFSFCKQAMTDLRKVATTAVLCVIHIFSCVRRWQEDKQSRSLSPTTTINIPSLQKCVEVLRIVEDCSPSCT